LSGNKAPLVLGVGGSPREGGNTEALLERFLNGAAAGGARTELVLLRRLTVLPCQACERCRRDGRCTKLLDGMQDMYPKIKEAKGLILGSPVHSHNLSASLKAFLDRLYCFYDFGPDRPRRAVSRLAGQGRKALVFAVGEQMEEAGLGLALPAMSLPLSSLGYEVMGELAAPGFFDLGSVAKDRDLLARAFAQGQRLAEAL